jgi:ABC-2 type transport system ATP-binding protein
MPSQRVAQDAIGGPRIGKKGWILEPSHVSSLCFVPVSGHAIEVLGLRKSYGSFEAVRGIDLNVSTGEVFALLGPNGAGKTTTVEILEGYRERNRGEVSVLGHDPARGEQAFKTKIGIVLQETGIDPYLTVAETIDQYRDYFPNPRPRDEVIEVVGLGEKRNARVSKLSGGQKRRLDVAIGLAGDPELLFLDEPTTGFDPGARRNAWTMVENLQSLGKTIFLTTHYMDEAQHLADRVAIIVGGQIVAQGPPGNLAEGQDHTTRISFRLPEGGPDLPESLRDGASVAGDRVELAATDAVRTLHDLTGWALENHVELAGLNVAHLSLEDVYLQLTSVAEQAKGSQE